MKTKFIFLVVLVCSIQMVCAQTKLYVNKAFKETAKSHRLIAVVPFKVQIKLRQKQMEKISKEQLTAMEKAESFSVQNALHSYLLSRGFKKNLDIRIKDLKEVNIMLSRKEITSENIDQFTSKELAEILGVDAVVSGTFFTERPTSDEAALAVGAITGFWFLSTNSGRCAISINDAKTGDLMWKYDRSSSSGLGRSSQEVIDRTMRNASRRLPYLR